MKSFYEMAILMEGVYRPDGGQTTMFGVRPKQDAARDPAEEIRDLLGDNYKTFVKKLDANINDPKFLAAIRSIVQRGSKVGMREMAVPCGDLRPTQNEVVLDKSLSFPMKKASAAIRDLGPGPVMINGQPIVTSNGGRFVIDGHHRWSEVYCMNPEAQMAAIDIGDLGTPEQALKAVQIAIAATVGDVPFAQGGGINLFEIDEGTLTNYVASAMVPEVVEVFKKMKPEIFAKHEEWQPPDLRQGKLAFDHGRDTAAIAEYIWGNVQRMNSQSRPVAPSPNREVMPQTDDAPGFAKSTVPVKQIAQMAATQTPQRLAAHTEIEGPRIDEWLALSGVGRP